MRSSSWKKKKTPQLSKTFSHVWNARLLLRTTCWSHRVCHKNSYVFIFSVMSVFGPIPSGGPWLASSFFLVFLRCVTYFWLEVSSSPQLHLHTSRCADSTATGCFETWKLLSCCIYKYNEFLAETSGRGNCSIYIVLRTSNGAYNVFQFSQYGNICTFSLRNLLWRRKDGELCSLLQWLT